MAHPDLGGIIDVPLEIRQDEIPAAADVCGRVFSPLAHDVQGQLKTVRYAALGTESPGAIAAAADAARRGLVERAYARPAHARASCRIIDRHRTLVARPA